VPFAGLGPRTMRENREGWGRERHPKTGRGGEGWTRMMSDG
jgi:hypothetical protein